MRRRSAYGAAAARLDDDEAPSRPAHGCAASGCPLSSGIERGGRRLCCVHLAIIEGSEAEWNEATRKVRRQVELQAIIGELRRSGHDPDVRAAVLRAMPALRPPDGAEPTWHRLLYRAESAMVAVCTEPDATQMLAARDLVLDAGHPATREDKRAQALDNVQWLADRRHKAVPFLLATYRRIYGHDAPIVEQPRHERQPGED